ncbi:hypothetical protein CRE_29263 [Caenorhabditis remanei]|uniref:Uncharacterized protein n=1 Tax=Caenorhabditis remanei TaxID=31234 RepID=E3NNR9_CAERE|nr:hypothetical protein CRE_29263 [Caenorhabditis remanei]
MAAPYTLTAPTAAGSPEDVTFGQPKDVDQFVLNISDNQSMGHYDRPINYSRRRTTSKNMVGNNHKLITSSNDAAYKKSNSIPHKGELHHSFPTNSTGNSVFPQSSEPNNSTLSDTRSHAPDPPQQVVPIEPTDSIDRFSQDLDTKYKTPLIPDKGNKTYVPFPFKGKKTPLHQNSLIALTQLNSQIDAKLTLNAFHKRYNDIKQQQLKFGCVNETPENNKPIGSQYYIRHRVIVKPDFSTTKIRIVLDGFIDKEIEQ